MNLALLFSIQHRKKANKKSQSLHPGKFTWNIIPWRFGRWYSFPNRWLIGSMLIFPGVLKWLLSQTRKTQRTNDILLLLAVFFCSMLTWMRLGSLNIALIMANSEDYAVVKTVPSTDELEMIDLLYKLPDFLASLWRLCGCQAYPKNVELWKNCKNLVP